MQTVDKFGVLGPVVPYDRDELEKLSQRDDVAHVEVFAGTEENLKRRKALEGKKFGVGRRFSKTGGNKRK